MASVVNRQNGTREVQFTDPNGKRQTVRLGKMPKRSAGTIKVRVERLLLAKISRDTLDVDTAKWVADLDDVLARRLAAVGLIAPRVSSCLEEFIDGYVEGRTDVKPRTKVKFTKTKDYMVEFFGTDRRLRDISPGDADDWRIFLLDKGMGENTVRKHSQNAKQFFKDAKRRKLIESNPFAHLKSTVQANPDKFYFISTDEANRVLDACPDAEWRLIFALSRYGGLRCPSEHVALTWDCVDWDKERIQIKSPKTERHAGGASRTIPMFPELRKHLEDVFDQAPEGSTHVITRYRDGNTNLRTQLIRIIRRAGLEPWPKLFQNLRSTRETELAEEYPLQVVCSWIGNSKSVAAKHYLQTTDEHFAKATQKPTQTVNEKACQPMSWTSARFSKSLSGKHRHLLYMCGVGPAGLERSPADPAITAILKTADADSDVTPAILRRLATTIASLLTPEERQQFAGVLQDHTDNAPKTQDS